MQNGGITSLKSGTKNDSSANIAASADHLLATATAKFDWDAQDRERGRIRALLDAAFDSDFDGLCDDANELVTTFKDAFRGAAGISDAQAEHIIPFTLRALEAAVWKTDWRQGYKKTRRDACVPEVAAKLSIMAIRLVLEAFSTAGMRSYRNRNREFIDAMAAFAEEANGGVNANRSFYEQLGQRVAQVVLDHKLANQQPLFIPYTSDYQNIEEVALEQLVYFIRSGENGPIKIGIARDPEARLANLQTGHHEVLSIEAITVGGGQRESAYHEQFAAHRIRGEWFAPHPDILAEIDRINAPTPTLATPDGARV